MATKRELNKTDFRRARRKWKTMSDAQKKATSFMTVAWKIKDGKMTAPKAGGGGGGGTSKGKGKGKGKGGRRKGGAPTAGTIVAVTAGGVVLGALALLAWAGWMAKTGRV